MGWERGSRQLPGTIGDTPRRGNTQVKNPSRLSARRLHLCPPIARREYGRVELRFARKVPSDAAGNTPIDITARGFVIAPVG
jgi:hypothetical protein